ncbi:hypothetical protein HPYSS1_07980, partial [Helicobacter pylori SS1]
NEKMPNMLLTQGKINPYKTNPFNASLIAVKAL